MDNGNNRPTGWKNPQRTRSEQFVCGYCGNKVASDTGWDANGNGVIRICPECRFPTFIGYGWDGLSRMVVPASPPGRDVENVPEPIRALYSEARQSAGAKAFTASVLTCRKLLVDLACENDDTWERGKPFWQYVEYLSKKLFAPESGQGWIDRIRDQGNKATHELGVQREADAVELLGYVEMLLRLLYEFPRSPVKTAEADPTEQNPRKFRFPVSGDDGGIGNPDSGS